ncbi:caspase domain-containing protein, partial [Armillaria novae-zelandiae]
QQYADELHELYHIRRSFAQPRVPRSENDRPSAESILSQASKSDKLPDGSRIWALIVGINEYEDAPLNGCVNDADLMMEFITKDLRVPQEHVTYLLNKSATRAKIISALWKLCTDKSILHKAIVVIYFAGHGSSYVCSECHSVEPGEKPQPPSDVPRYCCPVEAICPFDRGIINDQFRSGVPDIGDREINTILGKIAHPGRRITVIFDCCHSGGGARQILKPNARTLPPLSRAVYDDMCRESMRLP